MELEQIKPARPNFAMVGILFALTILVIFIAAVIILTWRAHGKEKAPFTKHPVAVLQQIQQRTLPA